MLLPLIPHHLWNGLLTVCPQKQEFTHAQLSSQHHERGQGYLASPHTQDHLSHVQRNSTEVGFGIKKRYDLSKVCSPLTPHFCCENH